MRNLLAGVAISLLLFGCGQAAVSRTSCSQDSDCEGGVCNAGYCLDLPGGDYSGGDASDDDAAASDASVSDGAVSVGDVAVSEDTDSGTARLDATVTNDRGPSNQCGGTEQLPATPGTQCGACGDGEWECDGGNALVCAGEGELNACGGCGNLDVTPNTPCLDCERGRWICSGTSLVCNCPGDDPVPAACQDPLEIELGEEIIVDLCPRPDEMANLAGGECDEHEIHGPEAVYRLTLDERTSVRLALWDDDDTRAIDTLLYVRRQCEDRSSQVACADDEPCDAENRDLGLCTGDQQPRLSVIDTVMDAGDYFIVVDTYEYAQNGVSYSCGTVHLETEESPIEF